MSWAAVAAVAAAVIAAGSAAISGEQQRKISSYNADVAERAAREKRAQAAYAADREAEKNASLRARQRLAFNLSGVTPAGTPTDLLLDTTSKMELDALAIRYGGASAGSALETQAQLQRMQGGAAASAGWWNAGSSLLSGATKIQNAYSAPTKGGTDYSYGVS